MFVSNILFLYQMPKVAGLRSNEVQASGPLHINWRLLVITPVLQYPVHLSESNSITLVWFTNLAVVYVESGIFIRLVFK